jgi:hypothetical protein
MVVSNITHNDNNNRMWAMRYTLLANVNYYVQKEEI